MVLNLDGEPAVVVLTVERYNLLMQKDLITKSQESKRGKNQKVLVTGGAGYIGGHLVKELIKAGYEVVVLDNLSTGRRENVDEATTFVEGDLADENLLTDLFSNNEFEAVFHLAASLEVEESVREPQKYLENNAIKTFKLLKAMDEAGCRKIIFSSTAAVYGPNENLIAEISPLKPNNPYGASKLLAERIIKYFCEHMGFSAVVFRYFNACGFAPGTNIVPTHQSHLIYNVMMVAKGEQPNLQVFGKDYNTFDGTCVRDYVHVLDVAYPHILALEKLDFGPMFEVYNIGSGKGSSVEQVANTAAEVINKIIPMEIAPRRAGDAAITVSDNSKLRTGLGYELKYSNLENIINTSWEVIKNI